MYYFVKQCHLWSIMSEQPIELSLVKVELMSKMLLHCVNPNKQYALIGILNAMTNDDDPHFFKISHWLRKEWRVHFVLYKWPKINLVMGEHIKKWMRKWYGNDLKSCMFKITQCLVWEGMSHHSYLQTIRAIFIIRVRIHVTLHSWFWIPKISPLIYSSMVRDWDLKENSPPK